MTKRRRHIGLLILFLFLLGIAEGGAQTMDTTKPRVRVDALPRVDSPRVQNRAKVDSVIRLHSPKKAAIRSALVPGLGQIYNKRYWKLPLVYGALGVTAGIFFYNLGNYRDLRFTYQAMVEASSKYTFDPVTGDTLRNPVTNRPIYDSTNYRLIRPEYLRLDPNSVRTYRDEFRQNMDYSVLFFLLFWGLQVVDAAVDAHLKAFDVSPNLSLRFKFAPPNPMTRSMGISLVLAFK